MQQNNVTPVRLGLAALSVCLVVAGAAMTIETAKLWNVSTYVGIAFLAVGLISLAVVALQAIQKRFNL